MRATLLLVTFVAATPLVAELRLELVRESLSGTHCRYREYVDGIPNDEYVTLPCADPHPALRDAQGHPLPHAGEGQSHPLLPLAGEGARSADEGFRRLRGRIIRREIIEDAPLHPFAHDYDATTGALVRRIPLFFHAKPARVFDPNPVAALNAPSLQDGNDAASAVPNNAYTLVDLQGVVESGPLRGPHVTLVDKQVPNVAPPDAAGSLLFDRAADGFEDVNAYFHIDRAQRYLQSLGYRNARAIAPYAIETDVHAAGGLDNSIFVPSGTQLGIGTLFFGEGGTDDAEDADLIVHEYGHAILEWIAPGTFSGTFASEARAISEGFGDYWAFSNHYAQRVASGRDPFCFADWDARCWTDDATQQCAYPPGSDCLRRLDSARTMRDYEFGESAGVEHRNGQIWSSALREIFVMLGKPVTDTIVLEAIFSVPSQPSFAVMAQRLIDADRLLYDGAHALAICAAMRARGIVTECAIAPHGGTTHFVSTDGDIAIPEATPAGIVSRLTIADSRAIESLFVRVDIEHPSRGDLRIELVAPDGTVIVLQQISFDRAADVHATFGLDAATVQPLGVLHGRVAAGVWQLRVADLRLRDVGTLLSWGLAIEFAGEQPPATRPRGARAQMIPVIVHRHGANETFFTSDLRIANIREIRETATLIYTRGAEDGLVGFAAVNVVLEPGQTLAFDDVLQSVFHTSGSGSLEVLGEVLVTSRVRSRFGGLQLPPLDESTALGEEPLHVVPLGGGNRRVNVGITEIAGAMARVTIAGVVYELLPFSHIQIPVANAAHEVSVTGGGGRVVAYAAQIDNASGDGMLVPAVRFSSETQTVIAPAARTRGVGGTEWRTDVWLSSASEVRFLGLQRTLSGDVEDVLLTAFGHTQAIGAIELTLPPAARAFARIATASTNQFAPFLPPHGPAEQHLLFIESTAEFRTNIGIVANEPALAELIVYDGGGSELLRETLFTSAGVAQRAVVPHVRGGRALVRFLSGRGRAYASVIDNASSDATFVAGR